MINKKQTIIILFVIIVVGIVLIVFDIFEKKEITPPSNTAQNSIKVTISTDKNDYNEGENIGIVVKNGFDNPILHYDGRGDLFWSLEYFKDDKWINLAYKGDGNFQLTEKDVGDNCYIILYERRGPVELEPHSSISNQWNQKICPFGTNVTKSPAEPRVVKYIGNGKYRFIFIYGFEISEDDPFKLSETKTVYSDTFTIK